MATQHPAQRHQGHGDQPHDLGEPADVLTRLRGPAQERAPGAPAAVGAGGPRPGRPRGQGRQRSQPDGEGEELGEEDGDARRDPHHGQQATVFTRRRGVYAERPEREGPGDLPQEPRSDRLSYGPWSVGRSFGGDSFKSWLCCIPELGHFWEKC